MSVVLPAEIPVSQSGPGPEPTVSEYVDRMCKQVSSDPAYLSLHFPSSLPVPQFALIRGLLCSSPSRWWVAVLARVTSSATRYLICRQAGETRAQFTPIVPASCVVTLKSGLDWA